MGQFYTTFDEIIRESKIRTMRQVRSRIVNKFVRKTIKHNKFKKWFMEDDCTRMNTRAGNRKTFKPVPARRAFYQNSPIPTLTNIAKTLTST